MRALPGGWLWNHGRLLLGASVLAVLVWQLGAGPFVDGLREVDGRVLVAGGLVGLVTTVCAAWRWRVVSHGLGVGLELPRAVASSYRAQFLNSTLPGGVLGDVHRGVRHGVDAGDVGRGVRAVVWDRCSGQVVQILLTVLVLLALPSPVDPMVLLGTALAVGLVLGVLLLRARRRSSRVGLAARTVVGDLRAVLTRRSWPVVVVASTVAVSGYVVTFLVAADATGVDASWPELVPIALLVLLGMSVPANLAGWGPREGVAAWAFASAGLGASAGVSTAVVYGVMSLAAALPGAVVLLAAWVRPRVVPLEGVGHG